MAPDAADSSEFRQLPLGRRIDMLCDAFEAEWLAGRTPSLEPFLSRVTRDERPALLRELAALEIDYRKQRGETISADEFYQRFPTYREIIAQIFSSQPAPQPGPPLEHRHGALGDPTPVGRASDSSNDASKPFTMGQYRLLEKLGQGGMGTVYRAVHMRLEKEVALKVLPAERTTNAEAVARFKREMRAVGRLHHPNIVAAYDAGEADGAHFLVMEYVRGVDLTRILNEHGPLNVADACELIRQAAIGLQEAHEHGMVHRDIKPSNLMLTAVRQGKTAEGVVKILDLGLALLGDQWQGGAPSTEITTSGHLMGTVDYIAPEQATNTHDVDIRADIYSLGTTLYKLLCGKAPFEDPRYDSIMKRLLAVVNTPAPPLRAKRPDVPEKLAHVIECLMAKDPALRPATPDEAALLLEEFCTGHDILPLIRVSATDIPPPRRGSTSRVASPAEWTMPGSASLQTMPPEPVVPNDAPRSPMTSSLATLAEPTKTSLTHQRYRRVGIFATAIATALIGAYMAWSRVRSPNAESLVHANSNPQIQETLSRGEVGRHAANEEAPPQPGDWSRPVNAGPNINSSWWDEHPALSSDGRSLWLASGGSIFVATRSGVGQPFGARRFLPTPVSDDSAWDAAPSISGDGRILVIESTRAGGLGGNDLWLFTRGGAEDEFDAPRCLPEPINTAHADGRPCISTDGLTLLFASNRSPTLGDSDLWMCQRNSRDEDFGPPESLGPEVNSAAADLSPSLSSDGLLLVFHSNRPGGFGQADLWTSRRESRHAPFPAAVNLGPQVNTLDNEANPSLSSDGQTLLFDSDRPGGFGKRDIWLTKKIPRLASRDQDLPAVEKPEAPEFPFSAEQAAAHQAAWASFLELPLEYKNSLGMIFRLIPAGTFLMGSTEAQIEEAIRETNADAGDNVLRVFLRAEGPQRSVTLSEPFYLGAYEVTQEQYRAVTGSNPAYFSREGGGSNNVAGRDTSAHPVESVRWRQAAEFCTQLSDRERLPETYRWQNNHMMIAPGSGYRLPTEAEWEFACRAGAASDFYSGDSLADLERVAWVITNSGGRTHAVGEREPNAWGLFDIHGNVWEWCQDAWDPRTAEPRDQRTILQYHREQARTLRYNRGGGWSGTAVRCRSAYHFADPQTMANRYVGFRVLLPVSAVQAAVSHRGGQQP